MKKEHWLDELLEDSMGSSKISTSQVIKGRGVILFGAGSGGETAIKKIKALNVPTKILDIFDNSPDKWGRRCIDLVIKSPRYLSHYDKETMVIVSSMYFAEIAKQLLDGGFENVYDYHMLFPVHSDYFFEKSIIERNRTDIELLESILYDNESKAVLRALIDYRLTLRSTRLLGCDIKDQYFPADIIKLSNCEVFVDAGAFIGMTTLEFVRRVKNEYQKVICFEPSENNFRFLKKNLESHNVRRVQLFKYGVYDFKSEFRFSSGDDACSSSHISDTGSVRIQTIAIDEILQGEMVSYIKMDIEGAEVAALQGAKQTILRDYPTLAISVYHTPEDLWRIPLMLKHWVPEYRIYLRNHSGSLLETVCYAVKSY